MGNNNQNTGVDFRNIDSSDTLKEDFPASIKEDFRVYFAEDAYAAMKKHANTTTEVELGGVLLGDVCKDSRGFFLKITGVIEGQHSNNYGTQITFTHDTWQHINEVKDSKYADKKIIGWYHTHPGFGVFLSEMDYFIQENFFNQPYQVAVVVETKDNTEGAFIWEEGKCVPLQRYWHGKEEVKLTVGKAEQFSPESIMESTDSSSGSARKEKVPEQTRGESISTLIMTIIMMVLIFILGTFWGRLGGANELQKNIMASVQSELYSLLEFASQSTGAQMDLESVKLKLKMAEDDIKNGNPDKAAVALASTREFIEALKTTYKLKRSDFRNELLRLQKKKTTIGMELQKANEERILIRLELAQMNLLAIKQIMVQRNVPFKMLPPGEQMLIKDKLDNILETTPQAKPYIKELLPGVYRDLYMAPPPKNKTSFKKEN